ncbi:MAG: hypothetical protein IJ300_10370 [Clostridia bacterium]|nr:hypothetical protein [Clostridia bacterium]MBQ8146385.1 hypothetical protein [Clostridia bacterium]
MENLFEAIMLICLCISIIVMLVRFIKHKSVHLKLERAILITFGIGFVLGAIGKAVIAPVEWTFALYVLGAYLSYTATVFSFSKIDEKNEVCENE